MRRALVLTTVLTAASALAGAACAQSAPVNGAGLRYLSWPGKPPVPAAAPGVVPVSRTLPLARLAPAPTAGASAAASVETPRRGLTPATAWTGASPTRAPQAYPTPAPVRRPAPEQVAAAPTPAPAPAPTQPHQAEPVQPQPVHTPPPQTEQARAAPTQAGQAPAAQPPAAQSPAAQAPAAQAAADPMAPRRDAPIYRLMQTQGGMAASTATNAADAPRQAAQLAPGEQSARYYSVHRQAGRHPDAIPAPQPTYLDALPVQMTQTPQSNDLAQPDGPPALIRNTNGSLRAVPQTQSDDLP